MSTPTRAFKGVWIPAEIWNSTELLWTEKCLLAEIDSLDNGEGCWASNDYLAEKMQTTKGNIANTISKLRGIGLIETVKSDGRNRWLKVRYSTQSDLTQTSPTGEPSIHPQVIVTSPTGDRNDSCYIDRENNEVSLCENRDIKPPSAEKQVNSPSDPNSKESLALALYKSYPRKVGKNAALKAILKAMKDHSFDHLLERVAKYAECTRSWPEDQLRFIPHPATWFNGGRYEDDEREWIKTARPTSSPIAQRIDLQKRIESIDEQIKEHPGNPEWIGYDQRTAKQQDKEALQLLRKQLAELRKQLNATP